MDHISGLFCGSSVRFIYLGGVIMRRAHLLVVLMLLALTINFSYGRYTEPDAEQGWMREVGRLISGAIVGEAVRTVVDSSKKHKPSKAKPRPKKPEPVGTDPGTGGPRPAPCPAPN